MKLVDLALPMIPEAPIRPTPTGDLHTVTGTGSLRMAYLRRMLVTRGRLLHRPEYGVGIRNFIEGPATDAAMAELGGDTRSNLIRDRRIESVEVTTRIDPDLGQVEVGVRVTTVDAEVIEQPTTFIVEV